MSSRTSPLSLGNPGTRVLLALLVLAWTASWLPQARAAEEPAQFDAVTAGNDGAPSIELGGLDLDDVVLPGDLDHAMVAIARTVEGFGGAYVRGDASVGDEETLVLWLDEATRSTSTVQALLVESLGERFDQDRVETQVARYDFEKLKLWQTALSSLPSHLLTFTDVDERLNRVVVGVPASQAQHIVETAIQSSEIPEAAVLFEVADPVQPALRSSRRPMRGGLQIQFQTGSFGLSRDGICTLGYPAVRNGVAGFITNSHCSRTQGEVDSARYWQATRPLTDGSQVGTETVDPAYTRRSGCPSDRLCRLSDANFVRAHDPSQVVRGRIARIGTNTTAWNGTNLWRVTSTPSTSLDTVVTKVGRTTGLTSGFVRRTCVTFPQAGNNLAIQCDHLAELRADAGDSGAPVFRVTNSPNTHDVAGLGVLWGTTTFNGQPAAVFSPIAGVRTEVGGSSLNVCASGFSC